MLITGVHMRKHQTRAVSTEDFTCVLCILVDSQLPLATVDSQLRFLETREVVVLVRCFVQE